MKKFVQNLDQVCSICCEDMLEDVVYLPCNVMHVYHALCI